MGVGVDPESQEMNVIGEWSEVAEQRFPKSGGQGLSPGSVSGVSGAPHLHKVALKDGEVSQLVELAAQEVALEPSGPAHGIGWNQGAFWRGKIRGSSPGDWAGGPPPGW